MRLEPAAAEAVALLFPPEPELHEVLRLAVHLSTELPSVPGVAVAELPSAPEVQALLEAELAGVSAQLWEQPVVAQHAVVSAPPEVRPLVQREAAARLDEQVVWVGPSARQQAALRVAVGRLWVVREVLPWVALSEQPSDLQELALQLAQR